MSASSLFLRYSSSASNSDENDYAASRDSSPQKNLHPLNSSSDAISTAHSEGSTREQTTGARATTSPAAQQFLATSCYEPAPDDRDSPSSDPDWDITLVSSDEKEADSKKSDLLSFLTGHVSTAGNDIQDNIAASAYEGGDGDVEVVCYSRKLSAGNLQRAHLAQQKALERKTASLVHLRGQNPGKRRNSDLGTHEVQTREKPAKRVWLEYCTTPKQKFLADDSILVPDRASPKPGQALVYGLQVTEENNLDMQFMYETTYSTKSQMGHPSGSCNLFHFSVGQVIRVYLLLHSEQIHTLWIKGMLFRAVTNMEPVQAFVKCFEIGASPTTVQSKNAELTKLAIYDGRSFSQKNSAELEGRAETVAEYLTAVSAAYKRESCMVYQRRNTFQSRMKREMYLSPKNFDTSLSMAVSELDDIFSSLHQVSIIGESHQEIFF